MSNMPSNLPGRVIDLEIVAAALGTMSTQNANNVAITGGSITGVTIDSLISDGNTRITYTDNGASAGPEIDALRESTTPAANDELAAYRWLGMDSAGNIEAYASILGQIIDPTSTSEDGQLIFNTVLGGTFATRMRVAGGVIVGTPTGGDQGGGTVNAPLIYANGQLVFHAGNVASQAQMEAGSSTTTLVTPGRQQFHSSASKGWGHIVYSAGAPVAEASYNISSVTDTGTGVATPNWGTDFGSADYAAVVTIEGTAEVIRTSSKAAGSISVEAYDIDLVGLAITAVDCDFSIVAFGAQS